MFGHSLLNEQMTIPVREAGVAQYSESPSTPKSVLVAEGSTCIGSDNVWRVLIFNFPYFVYYKIVRK